VNDELEKVYNGTVVAYFEVLSRYSHSGTEYNHVKPQDSELPTEVRTWNLLNTSLNRYRLGYFTTLSGIIYRVKS
jgi:hypothetical protein